MECWFHYGQCVFNKIVEIGLKKDYSDDEDLRIVVQNCIALALCYHKNFEDSEIIDIYCDHVCGKSEPLIRKYPRFKEFLDYMALTWLEGDEEKGIPPFFNIDLWNHWNHMETRTNNTNESYNHRIVIKLGNITHPLVFVLVEFIQVEDFLMCIKYEEIEKGVYKPRSRAKQIAKDLVISNAKLEYLQSNRGYTARETLLEKFRVLCPKASWDKQ